jgi:hypothetical protein
MNSFSDNLTLIHFIFVPQGGVATTLTQPIDVIKTRVMNARPGEFKVNNHIQHSVTSDFQNHIRILSDTTKGLI